LTTRISHSVHETESLGAELARTLRGGECVALYGDLGAGKTQFVRGIVQGLNGNAHAVSSPTFVLLNVYDSGRLKVFHLDAYRIGGADDFEAIGFAELLEQGGVVVVEWAQRVEELLPEKRIDVRISTTGKNSRRFEISDLKSEISNLKAEKPEGERRPSAPPQR
jgi:tRNA threonylcarbamoyladenosine biosynthesis protein TsaE